VTENHFKDVYAELHAMMKSFAHDLVVKADSEDGLMVVGPKPDMKGRELWFGGFQIKKNYVSYHLMPVYMNPGLLEGLSPELRKRMQGKSCFNFKKVDEKLFSDLRDLTQKGHDWFLENADKFVY
jgi:hypothetical protein